MKLLLRWLLSAVTIYIISHILPGVSTASFTTALVVALVLGLVNVFIRPLLILLTLPATILTLGLFTFVINAFLIWLVHLMVTGFYLQNFGSALEFAILLSIINMIFRSTNLDRKDSGKFYGNYKQQHNTENQNRRTVEGRIIS